MRIIRCHERKVFTNILFFSTFQSLISITSYFNDTDGKKRYGDEKMVRLCHHEWLPDWPRSHLHSEKTLSIPICHPTGLFQRHRRRRTRRLHHEWLPSKRTQDDDSFGLVEAVHFCEELVDGLVGVRMQLTGGPLGAAGVDFVDEEYAGGFGLGGSEQLTHPLGSCHEDSPEKRPPRVRLVWPTSKANLHQNNENERDVPVPTKISSNSEPEAWKKGTPGGKGKSTSTFQSFHLS